MFTVKTKIKESSIHGIGVFADEFVAKGTVIWKYVENFDITINDTKFDLLPKAAQEYLLHYAYYNKNDGGYVLCGDNGKYTNHSETPNVKMLNVTEQIAIKNIEIDEEITENYYSYDEHAKLKLESHMIKEYVVTFLFTTNMNKIWLVEKQKPDWQKGCLNGIGGKIEKDELPIDAAIRELKEEAGIDKMNLCELGYMFGNNNDNSEFKVWIYTGVTDIELKTMETEQILLKSIDEVKEVPHIENVPMLIEACLYKLKGHSHFSRLIMEY